MSKKYTYFTLDQVEEYRNKKYPYGVKQCYTCKIYKSFGEFRVIKNNPAWLHSWCNDCNRAYGRKRAYPPGYEAERGRRRSKKNNNRSDEEVKKEQERLHPDGTKVCRTCKKTLPLRDFHKGSMQNDGLYASCRKCSNKKRTKRRYKIYEEYWSYLGIPLECYLCGGDYQEVEHIVPEVLGGQDICSNTRPVCISCNHGAGGKHGIPMEEFIYRTSHPSKPKAIILEGLMLDGTWPFSVEYGSKEWEELEISGDPEFAHLFD